ncbi:hypothetical protein C0431_10270 [bacterium]|nr:hypothetical protein [bacterium]
MKKANTIVILVSLIATISLIVMTIGFLRFPRGFQIEKIYTSRVKAQAYVNGSPVDSIVFKKGDHLFIIIRNAKHLVATPNFEVNVKTGQMHLFNSEQVVLFLGKLYVGISEYSVSKSVLDHDIGFTSELTSSKSGIQFKISTSESIRIELN